MQRQAKKRSGDAGGAGGTKRAVTPRSAFIVLACTAIAEYFAFYLRLADAGAKAGIPHGGYVMCALICGVASLATTAGFGLLLFAERNRLTKNLKQLLITVILLLVSTVLSAFTTCVGYAFTAAFLGIILAALLVGRHCAYACTAMLAVYAALFACLPDAALAYKPLSMLAAVSAGGFAAVIALKINKGRTSPIISGVIGGIVSGIILICVQAFFGVRITDVLLDACGLLASSALCGVLAVGLMPVCESIFDVTTETRLNDLLNNNNPLLKRLMFEAPGTYHHSILVAALAESAADEVDANSLLCKVAAYYHDVGKLTSPAHFIENQRDYNIHDELPPEESARRIISHQSDGVTLLKKHKFPSDVIEIVAQHHGQRAAGRNLKRQSARRPLVRFVQKRQRQREKAAEDHVLRRVHRHHHVQRIEREKDRCLFRRPRAGLPRNRAAGQRKAPRQQRHLQRGIQRRAEVDIAQRAAKLQQPAQRQRVQQRMMRRICARDHLPQLIRHIVGERTGERDAEHRHIAGQNKRERPPRAECFFLPQRARIAALQQHGEQRRNRPDEQRCNQQRAPRPDDPAVLGLPAKGGKKRVHCAANQADGQLSAVQFLEHAAPPSLFLSVSVSQQPQKGNCGLLRGAIRALSRNFGAEIFAEFRFSSYFCHIPAL